MPRFSILTICYNAEDSIQKTIESVLEQTYKNMEYIIVDGASKDGTLSILQNYASPLMHVYSEPDQGISDAFNKAIGYAKGEYLLFLNSGDCFLARDILEYIDLDINSYSEDILGYSTVDIVKHLFPENIQEGEQLWEKSLIPHQGCLIKREVFEKVGSFNLYFKVRMDYDFFTRCRLNGITYRCIPSPIVYYDSSGISSTDAYRSQKEGMAVRLLYCDKVEKEESRVLGYLLEDKESTEAAGGKELILQRNLADKHFKIMMAMAAWINVLQNGGNVIASLDGMNNEIAIYGWGYLGQCLENELRLANIKVKYVIDQEKRGKKEEIEIYDWSDVWPGVDIIVVTPFYDFQKIKEKIKKKIKCKVMSIEEIIMGWGIHEKVFDCYRGT